MPRPISEVATLSLENVVSRTSPWLDIQGNVLVATGRSGSGKSTLCRSLVLGRSNCAVINIGDVMQHRIQSSTNASFCKSEIGHAYISSFGEEEIAADINYEILRQWRAGASSFVIDGLRLPRTLCQLRMLFGGRLVQVNISEPLEVSAERRSRRDCVVTTKRIDQEEADLTEHYKLLEASADFKFQSRRTCSEAAGVFNLVPAPSHHTEIRK